MRGNCQKIHFSICCQNSENTNEDVITCSTWFSLQTTGPLLYNDLRNAVSTVAEAAACVANDVILLLQM
jgi:hypothetical protein